jgi:hypothetical protein
MSCISSAGEGILHLVRQSVAMTLAVTVVVLAV